MYKSLCLRRGRHSDRVSQVKLPGELHLFRRNPYFTSMKEETMAASMLTP